MICTDQFRHWLAYRRKQKRPQKRAGREYKGTVLVKLGAPKFHLFARSPPGHQAVKTVDPKLAVGKLHRLWLDFAKFFEDLG